MSTRLNSNKENKINDLFQQGLEKYHKQNYFEAHEAWEELWLNYYLPDRKFIQGLIQLAVSFVHLENGNMKGANSLLKKSIAKFDGYSDVQRGIDMDKLKQDLLALEHLFAEFESVKTFDWQSVPRLI